MTPDLRALHQQGRLSQTCPACGVSEAAGAYCSACLAPTGEGCWTAREMGSAQRDGLAAYRASRKQEGAIPGAVA